MVEPIPKIRIMKGAEPDLSAATFQIHDESHTTGNALRWMLMKNPKVEFCGYRNVGPANARWKQKKVDKVNGSGLVWEAKGQMDSKRRLILMRGKVVRQPPGVTTCDQCNIQVGWFCTDYCNDVPHEWMIAGKCASTFRIILPAGAPHPSENVIQVRIQMYDNLSSLSALITALTDLDSLCETVEDAYIVSLTKDKYERWPEKS